MSGGGGRLWRRSQARPWVVLGLQTLVFAVVYGFAFFVRNDFRFDSAWVGTYLATALGVVVIKSAVFYGLGQCHVSWSRIAFGDLTALIWAATLAMLVLTSVEGLIISSGRFGDFPRIPRSVIVLDWAGTVLAIGGIRALWRSIREELRPIFSSQPVRTAVIVGADEAGEQLARSLATAAHSQYYVAGFLDDDPTLQNHRVAGLEVLGSLDRAAAEVERRRIDEVLVPAGKLVGKRLRQLLDTCQSAGASVKVVPAIDEILANHASAAHFRARPVEIKDLLRRDPVELDTASVRAIIEDRVIMVTGAGGSIGSELCRQVLRYHPRRLLLVERGENALFLLDQEFSRHDPRPPCEPLLADVADEARMDQIMRDHQPDVIFHAAAHKHVPMMEWNPAEAIKNNVVGTQTLARLADRHGVREFVMISTDKAVNPTSVMGCSKLVAERYVQALSGASRTKFLVVRFGNVLGSNGSVVPLFQEQIRMGGPITITHPEITRYFMLIPEASQLVLQAASMGKGGEIFVLDMGESMLIVDLARDLIGLSGFEPDDIEIVFTGLRPGEKLFEELYFDDEQRLATSHAKVCCAQHRPVSIEEAESLIDRLVELVDEPPADVKRRLREIVPEYGASAAAESAPEPPRKASAK